MDRVPSPGVVEPPRSDDIEWCVQIAHSPAVLWRVLEHPLVQETDWYKTHRRDAMGAILDVVRTAPCVCGCGIEIAAPSLSPADGRRLARGMADAVVEYAMGCEYSTRAPNAGARLPESRRNVRVMIRDDEAASR